MTSRVKVTKKLKRIWRPHNS